ncbi:MAG TPA: energy transducer TonB [Thermoanaerobaculia bacterium]|nr:energy transducer TonB [Thermoanaerobaculia bacterium]
MAKRGVILSREGGVILSREDGEGSSTLREGRSLAALGMTLLLIAASAFAADDDVTKGLKNLTEVHDIARIFELRHAMPSAPLPPERGDPWGTAYRIEEDSAGYRIISAGSDLTFDEKSWSVCTQFEGNEGDVVFESGAVCRTNRQWLHDRIAADAGAQAALDELHRAETQFMIMRTPVAQALTLAKLTAAAMQGIGTLIETYRTQHGDLTRLERAPEAMAALLARPATGMHPLTHDAWGTPFRLMIDGSSYRIISAGADRELEPGTWSTVAHADVGEDIVYANGKLVRSVPEREVLNEGRSQVVPLKQPVVPARAALTRFMKIDSTITAPVISNRVEPVYPEAYRRLGISGIVIIELLIAETGALEGARMLKSVAPELDMAAMTAVKQWKFRPAELNGKAVPVIFNLTVNFKLN